MSDEITGSEETTTDTNDAVATEDDKRASRRSRAHLGAGEDDVVTYIPIVISKDEREILASVVRARNAGKSEDDATRVGVQDILRAAVDAHAIVDSFREEAKNAPAKFTREMKLPDDPTERTKALEAKMAAAAKRMEKLQALLAGKS